MTLDKNKTNSSLKKLHSIDKALFSMLNSILHLLDKSSTNWMIINKTTINTIESTVAITIRFVLLSSFSKSNLIYLKYVKSYR